MSALILTIFALGMIASALVAPSSASPQEKQANYHFRAAVTTSRIDLITSSGSSIWI